LFIAALLLFAGLAVAKQQMSSVSTFEIDLLVSSSTNDPLALTISGDAPHVSSVRPNQPISITVSDTFFRERVAAIAIDNPGCSTIAFRRVKFTGDSVTLDYDAAQLKNLVGFFQGIGAAPRVGASGLAVETCVNPARFVVGLPAGYSPTRIRMGLSNLFTWLTTRDALFQVLGLLFVALLLGVFAARRDPAFVFLALAFVIMNASIAFSVRYLAPPDSIATAVGRAGFVGLSTKANVAATIMGMLVAAVVSALAAGTIGRRYSSSAAPDLFLTQPEAGRPPRHPWRVLLCAAPFFVLLALLFSYPLVTRLLSPNFQYAHHWDANNLLFWHYLADQGFRPLRDFWYPYAGQILFAVPAPLGEFWSLSYKLVLQALMVACLWRLLGSPIRAALVVIALILLEQANLAPNLSRYLLGVLIALSYVTLLCRRADPWTSLLFAASLLLALWFEPIQVFYAAPAIVATKLIVTFQGGVSLRAIREAGYSDVFVAVGAGATFLLYLWLKGDLGAFIWFHATLGAHSVSSSVPTDLAFALAHWDTPQAAVLIMPAFLVAVGTYWLIARPSGDRVIALTVIALGLVAFMMQQKHIHRDNRWEVLIPATVSVLLLVMWRAPLAPRVETAAYGACVGLAVFALWISGVVDRVTTQVASSARMVSAIALGSARVDLAQVRASRYAPERFEAFGAERSVLDRMKTLGGKSELPRFYAIGDMPLFYLLGRQVPPPHSNDFNASPIFEQRRVTAWLREKKPDFAIWNPDNKVFDDIQRVVRNPIVYAEVIDTFVPVENVEQFVILRRRRDNEPVALDWWREKVGSNLEFAYLLRASRPGEICAVEDASICRDMLEIAIDTPPAVPTRAVISFDIAGRTFTLAFIIDPNRRHYSLALHRVWFWNVAERNGLPHRIVATSPAIYTATLTREKADGRLY
jgi:hypothetical protein